MVYTNRFILSRVCQVWVVKLDKKRSISRYSFYFAYILPPFFEQLKCLQEHLKSSRRHQL